MESLFTIFLVPAVAVLLDIFLGDPQTFPHPVRYIGKVLDFLESIFRKMEMDLRLAGGLTMLFLCFLVWGGTEFLMVLPYIGSFIAIYLAYAGLALGSLLRECRQVARILDSGDLPGARDALAMLVSRDTSKLDEDGIRRSLAETISENLNDGFVAPMFYLTLFGPAGLWVYKTVSTMDSMWGYKTERFNELGYVAAKIDDVLAFIPARITAWALMFVGKSLGLNYEQAKSNHALDAVKMDSPNAGWPMAAAAWLVGGQMGGKTVYFGDVKDKPTLGPVGNIWDKGMIDSLLEMSKVTGLHVAWSFTLFLGCLRFMF